MTAQAVIDSVPAEDKEGAPRGLAAGGSRRGPLHRLSRIFAWCLLLVLLVLLAVTVIAPRMVGGESLTVLSGSMRPLLQPGDLAVIKPISPEEIGLGTVISYQLRSGEPELVTHRVIGMLVGAGAGERRFLTQGDANQSVDSQAVRAVQVRGELWYSLPWLGYLSAAVNPWKPTLLVVSVTALFGYAAGMGLGAARDGLRNQSKSGQKQRSRHRAAVPALLLIALGTGSSGFWNAAPAAQAAPAERLELSNDGAVWGPALTEAVLPEGQRLIPGEQLTRDFWVRNASAAPADLTAVLSAQTWRSRIASGDLVVTATARGASHRLDDSGQVLFPVAAGAVERIVLTVHLKEEAGPETQMLSLPLGPDLGLRQDVSASTTNSGNPAPPAASEGSALAGTGWPGNVWILGAGALLIVGMLLARSGKSAAGRYQRRRGIR
ncbi:signal peptidase I [Acaricomes phytoseiuli]|uniref:signal peptidase I n=1 Tax=Acaricomes phytoseiuli TaxID=291968 RepID=UPI0022235F47|nr:signal peptidase I [Acaricomes phytoseiuli]MCW1249268.1 signal peptidase I [Acaricomes phytoseiuli]